jgi:hypothetical protein
VLFILTVVQSSGTPLSSPPSDLFWFPERRKDILRAEDLGILLQWHWKYGMLTFTNECQRVQFSVLMLFSAFTGRRPTALLADDSSSSKDSQESSADDLSSTSLVDDSDGDLLVSGESDSKAQTTRPGTFCYGDIDHFLLRNPDNPERDILMAEVDFRNLKVRSVVHVTRWARQL